MTRVHYHIVEHDGGWAYRVDGVYSETFRSHAAAVAAARNAAAEQHLVGETTEIQFQDESGNWRIETAPGDDRPEADVVED